MEKITIAVLRIQGGWRVMKDDRQVGQYDYRIDAEGVGFDLTQRLRRSGRDVELLVQQDGAHDVTPLRGLGNGPPRPSLTLTISAQDQSSRSVASR